MLERTKGITAASASAIFLGLAPVFGRKAILLGMPAMAVVATRTLAAALLLLIVIAIFKPKFLYIYPAGLLGCLLAGTINGFGSLLFYGALARIDASIGQMLNSTYPLFVALFMLFENQRPSKLTFFRLSLTIPAVVLLTQSSANNIDLLGVAMMLGGAMMYGLHLPINQRVLYEMPAPTVTLYTLLSMSAVVVPWYFIFGGSLAPIVSAPSVALWSVLGLTIVTFLSRLTLFMGVKNLGGLQTAIIGLSELIVTVLIAFLWLGERLSIFQWLGALLLFSSVILIAFDKSKPPRRNPGGWLHWLTPPTPNIETLLEQYDASIPPLPPPASEAKQ